MPEDVNESTIGRLAAALEQWDLEEYEVVLADNAVEGRPQTRERFVGRTNIMGMYRHFPDTHLGSLGAELSVETTRGLWKGRWSLAKESPSL